VEGRGVARDKRTARDLGVYLCFEDEAGQGRRSPEGRTWAPRAARPVVRVRSAGGGGSASPGWRATGPGPAAPVYKLRVYRRHKGEPKGFTWQDYRDLIIATHRQLSAPMV
jgi:hypothetical protein